MQFTVVSWDTFDWSHDKIQQFLRFKLSCFYSAAKTNLLTDKSFVVHMLYKTCFFVQWYMSPIVYCFSVWQSFIKQVVDLIWYFILDWTILNPEAKICPIATA